MQIPKRCTVAVWFLAAMCFSYVARAHDLGDAGYLLPLPGDYAILKTDPWNVGADGLFLLGRNAHLASSHGLSQILVTRVRRIAIRDKVIIGATDDGFFLLDTSNDNAVPETFTSKERWLQRLAAMQIAADAEGLQSPDALASNLADEVLRPWDYQYLHNLFGVPDAGWSLILQILGLILSFILGVLNRPRNHPVSIAAGLGILVNIVGQMILAGEGPALCPGFVVFPLVFMLAAWVGGRARNLQRLFAHKPTAT